MLNIYDFPAFIYKLISKEHALVIKEFPAWVELWVNLLRQTVRQVDKWVIGITLSNVIIK